MPDPLYGYIGLRHLLSRMSYPSDNNFVILDRVWEKFHRPQRFGNVRRDHADLTTLYKQKKIPNFPFFLDFVRKETLRDALELRKDICSQEGYFWKLKDDIHPSIQHDAAVRNHLELLMATEVFLSIAGNAGTNSLHRLAKFISTCTNDELPSQLVPGMSKCQFRRFSAIVFHTVMKNKISKLHFFLSFFFILFRIVLILLNIISNRRSRIQRYIFCQGT